MTKGLLTYVITVLILSSCTQHVVCPAYQSAFIFDKPTAREKFVYYNESTTASKDVMASTGKTITLPARDSSWSKSTVLPGPALPKVQRVKMDKYLLLPEKTYKKALKSLQTVEMKQVLPKKDSADIKAELDLAARSVTDTLTAQSDKPKEEGADSVYTITKTKEKYNMDQDIYMWYFRNILVLPDVRAAMQPEKEAAAETETKQGFFKRLFSKKEKSENASEMVEEGDLKTDSTSVKQKKVRGSSKKTKSKVVPDDPKKKAEPAKKEEEDDGF